MKKILTILAISIFANDAASQRLRKSLIVLVNLLFIKQFHISEQYNVDPSSITVSGFSSGAFMATQFHFAHSSEIGGAGIIAGGFFFILFLNQVIK